ncbi:MAG: aldehyde dehydrogenase family protein, partial [Candidatus Methanomethylicia archaeon]
MTILPEVQSYYGRLKLYINGSWIDSKSSYTQLVMNPAKDEVIAEAPFATMDEVNEAVKAAAEAFEKWRETP